MTATISTDRLMSCSFDYRVGRPGNIVRDELVWALIHDQRCLPGRNP